MRRERDSADGHRGAILVPMSSAGPTPPDDAGAPTGATVAGGDPDADREEADLRTVTVGDATKTLAATAETAPPAEIHGRYHVLAEIGRGGMGTVYRALDVRLGRQVALKLVASSAAHRTRLLREAQALAQLAHPNVVPVYDVGTVDDAVFMAMELIDGVDLRAWLAAETRTPRQILQVFAAAGDGLAAAHAAGLVHRDFKPANVILGSDGRVRVVDFGLARTAATDATGTSRPAPHRATARDDTSSSGSLPGPGPAVDPAASALASSSEIVPSVLLESSLTQHGDIVGTPRYMSPEQRRGAPTDARTDQFSFCVALYEALYGATPFRARDARRRFDDGSAPPIDPPPRAGVPGHVRRALRRGLRRAADDRFPTMAALVAELRRDLRALRIRVGAGIAVVGSLGIAIAALAHSAPEPCGGAAERAAATIPARLRDGVTRALLGTGSPLAPRATERLDSQLDEYLRDWADLRTQTCRATRVHADQSEAVMDRKMACLDDRLADVGAFLGALADAPSEEAMGTAGIAIERAGALALCRDADALARRHQEPVKPDEMVTVGALDAAVRELDALVAVQNMKAAAPMARKVKDLAGRITHTGTRARAVFAYAVTQRQIGDLAESSRALDETLRLASVAGNPTLVSEAWAELLYIIAVEERRMEATHELVRATEVALLAARGEPDFPRLEADINHVLATVLMQTSQLAEAEKRFRTVLTMPENVVQRSASLNNLAITLIYLSRLDEARDFLRQSRELDESIFGDQHPYFADDALNSGLSYHWQGDLATAERWYREALEHSLRHAGASTKTLLFRLYLAHLLVDRGAWAEAKRELDLALAGYIDAVGPDAELTRHVRTQRARLALATGDRRAARAEIDAIKAGLVRTDSVDQLIPGHPEPLVTEARLDIAEGALDAAEAALQKALDRGLRTYGPSGLMVADVHVALAEAALAARRYPAAIERADEALALLARGGSLTSDPRRGDALRVRGQARAALGRRDDARGDLRQALGIWETAAPGHPRVAELRAAAAALSK
jgi:tetratricopeptide (TPR) repeat protein/predicted Ser/Thr protein kinase